jgi:hypothetical protein
VLCLRELLGSLQTLAWDKQCVKSILQSDVISLLYDFSQQADQEVSVLSFATLAVCARLFFYLFIYFLKVFYYFLYYK